MIERADRSRKWPGRLLFPKYPWTMGYVISPRWFQRIWLAVLVWLLVAYLLVNVRFPHVLSGSLNIYFAQPLTWCAATLLAYLGWRFDLRNGFTVKKDVFSMALLTGFFQVSAFFLAGLISGFGHSPYSHAAAALLGNILYIGSVLIAVEMSRAYLVAVFSKGNVLLGVLTPSLLFACLGIPLAKYSSISDASSLFKFYGDTLLPAFSENLLASFLAFLAGPFAAILYRGVVVGFEWFSPVLPNPPWTVTAFLGTIVPAFGLIVIRNQIMLDGDDQQMEQDHRAGLSSFWVIGLALSVALLWFNAGLFNVRPSLVNGSSMEPALNVGDVVITREVVLEDVQVGDIIRFRQGEIFILHRVMEIAENGADRWFVTRGDANNVNDPPVPGSAVEGKVVFVVPKLGWLSIGARKFLAWIL